MSSWSNIIFLALFLSLTKFTLQVWALAVGKKSEMLATGGGDAVINLWYDCTADDKEEAFREEVSYLTCYFCALSLRMKIEFEEFKTRYKCSSKDIIVKCGKDNF